MLFLIGGGSFGCLPPLYPSTCLCSPGCLLFANLIGVVSETMQPAHVSLRLRPDPPPRGNEGREEEALPNALSIPSAVLWPIEGIHWE
jgi:hypothetical protein